MPTPPVNLDERAYIDSRTGIWDVELQRWSSISSPEPWLFRRHVQNRPASTGHPKNGAGWRDPGAWDHSGFSAYFSNPPTIKNTISFGGYYYQYQMDGYGVPEDRYGLPAIPDDLVDTAINNALRNLKNSPVNYGNMFAQVGETTKMFTEVLGKITRTVQTFKANRPKDWAKVIRSGSREGYDIPGAWLELQYGWKPSLSDVSKAMDQIHHASSQINAYKASVTGKATSHIWDPDWHKPSGYLGGVYWPCRVEGSWKVKVRLDYNMSGPIIATLSQLGLINPLEIVWEKLPYSFVVDWCLPVGDYLSLLTADFGWDFVAGSVSTIGRCKVQSGLCRGVNGVSETTGARWNEDSFAFHRTRLDRSPMPRIHFKNPITAGHVANAMSLLVNCFR